MRVDPGILCPMTLSFSLQTLIPLTILAGLGWFVPWAIQRRMRDSLADLGWTLLISVILLTLIGAGIFAVLYWLGGAPDDAIAASLPRFIGLGASSALAWGPILILTALGLAQGIERRKGEAMAARDVDRPRGSTDRES